MEKKACLCLCYILLLAVPAQLLQEKQNDERRKKRVAVALYPLSHYAGTVVIPAIYTALVAAYGYLAVREYNVRSSSRSRASEDDIRSYYGCRNYYWCRTPRCFSHEREDRIGTETCLEGYKCCVPNNLN